MTYVHQQLKEQIAISLLSSRICFLPSHILFFEYRILFYFFLFFYSFFLRKWHSGLSNLTSIHHQLVRFMIHDTRDPGSTCDTGLTKMAGVLGGAC